MTSSVLAAFLASGGLKAGTPLAIASTPVRATEPLANALSSRNSPRLLGLGHDDVGLLDGLDRRR